LLEKKNFGRGWMTREKCFVGGICSSRRGEFYLYAGEKRGQGKSGEKSSEKVFCREKKAKGGRMTWDKGILLKKDHRGG